MSHPFENFLKGICFSENPEVLDDDMSDFFDNWMSNLEVEDILGYGNQFGNMLLNKQK